MGNGKGDEQGNVENGKRKRRGDAILVDEENTLFSARQVGTKKPIYNSGA